MYKFDINATNASKGIALMLILWHHLFYQHPEYGFIVFFTAKLAKVCVGIFVILSGYGLSESVKNKNIDLFAFYKKRLKKLYFNYWIIAAIFIPIGIIFMDRSLVSVFGNHEYLKLAIQMIGLHRFTGVGYGYNATWWFMSLIVALYLLFPFIYKIMQKYPYYFLLFSLTIMFLPLSYFPVLPPWILPFTLGIYLSNTNAFSVIIERLKKLGYMRFAVLIILILLVALQRSYGFFLIGIKIDWLFGALIILLTTEVIIWSKKLQMIFSFIGIHAFNIFLFHTFIYHYYWKDFIYSFNNPIIIFLVLLFVSIIISMIIELIKKYSSEIITLVFTKS